MKSRWNTFLETTSAKQWG